MNHLCWVPMAATSLLLHAARNLPARSADQSIRPRANVMPVFDVPANADVTDLRITGQCNSDIYFRTLRPDHFGCDGLGPEGVAELDGEPMTFVGGSVCYAKFRHSGPNDAVQPAPDQLLRHGCVHR